MTTDVVNEVWSLATEVEPVAEVQHVISSASKIDEVQTVATNATHIDEVQTITTSMGSITHEQQRVQTKIERVLEEQEVATLGGIDEQQTIRTDALVVDEVQTVSLTIDTDNEVQTASTQGTADAQRAEVQRIRTLSQDDNVVPEVQAISSAVSHSENEIQVRASSRPAMRSAAAQRACLTLPNSRRNTDSRDHFIGVRHRP